MSEAERKDLQVMKATLESYLLILNDKILQYKSNEDDNEFAFMLNKAAQYRDIIKTISEQLNQID